MKDLIILISTVFIIYSCTGKNNRDIPIDTLANYKNSVIIEKTEMSWENNEIIKLRIPINNSSKKFYVKEVKITNFEARKFIVGDTITDSLLNNSYDYNCDETITSLKNYYDSEVIDKDFIKTYKGFNYYLTIQIRDTRGDWNIKKIRVSEYDYKSIKVGEKIIKNS